MYDDLYRYLKYYMVLDAYYKLDSSTTHTMPELYFALVVVSPPNSGFAATKRAEIRRESSDPKVLDLLDRCDEFHYVTDEIKRIIAIYDCDQADLKANIPFAFQFKNSLWPSVTASDRLVPVDPHVHTILLKHLLLWNTHV